MHHFLYFTCQYTTQIDGIRWVGDGIAGHHIPDPGGAGGGQAHQRRGDMGVAPAGHVDPGAAQRQQPLPGAQAGAQLDLELLHRGPLRLGEGMFRHFSAVEDFDRRVETCGRALALVESLERPELPLATTVVCSYVELAKVIWSVSHSRARSDVANLDAAGQANVDAIRAWRTYLGPEPWHYRVHDALESTERTVREIGRFVEERYIF